jgi:hypothetical protein
MLERGAARHSTAPGPGPRAGRCAAPAPPTVNARCDPGPIVGILHRLGWGRVHDASRPGGSGAGTARRGAPRPAFSGRTLRTYSPGSCLLLRGWLRSIQVTTRSYARQLRRRGRPSGGRPAGRPRGPLRYVLYQRCAAGVPSGRARRADESAGQTVVQPRRSSDRAELIPDRYRPKLRTRWIQQLGRNTPQSCRLVLAASPPTSREACMRRIGSEPCANSAIACGMNVPGGRTNERRTRSQTRNHPASNRTRPFAPKSAT